MPVRVRIEAFSFELTHAVRLRRGCPLLPMRDRTASPAPGLHSSQGSYGSHNCAARLCRSGSFTVDMGLKASSSMARRQAFFFIFDMWCSSQSFCRMRPRHFMILTRRGLAHGSHGSPVSRQARVCPVRSKVRSWLADGLWEAGLAARTALRCASALPSGNNFLRRRGPSEEDAEVEALSFPVSWRAAAAARARLPAPKYR